MKNLIVSIVLVLALTFFAVNAAEAQPMQMQGKQPPHKMMMHKMNLMKKLNLTDEQKEKVAGLKIDFQKKMVDLKADLQKSKLDLQDLRVKGDLSRNDVLAAVENINKNRDAISLAVANHLLDVYQILTPEQQKIARENLPNFLQMRKHAGRMMRGKMMQR